MYLHDLLGIVTKHSIFPHLMECSMSSLIIGRLDYSVIFFLPDINIGSLKGAMNWEFCEFMTVILCTMKDVKYKLRKVF